jgi:hypothetical protein
VSGAGWPPANIPAGRGRKWMWISESFTFRALRELDQEEGSGRRSPDPLLGLAAGFADGREAVTDGSPRKDRGRPYRCWQ